MLAWAMQKHYAIIFLSEYNILWGKHLDYIALANGNIFSGIIDNSGNEYSVSVVNKYTYTNNYI
jgi:hypothetical protein